MNEIKISGLREITSVSSTDILEISQNAAGVFTSKKITTGNLLAAANVFSSQLSAPSAVIGGVSNNCSIDTTGHIVLSGSAKPWDDIRVEPTIKTSGTNDPSYEKWFDDAGLAIVSAGGTSRGLYLYSFTDVAASSEKEIFFTLQMPHTWDSGPIHIHVHWVGSHTQASSNPRWGLEYNWKSPYQTYAGTLTIYAATKEDGDVNTTAGKHNITEFAPLTPDVTQDGLSSLLVCRLFRNSSNVADTYTVAGNKCGLLYIDAHFQLNTMGSTDEYIK
jgi:hypothetical protein